VERLTGVYKNLTRGIVALVFRCRPAACEAMATDEARRVAWFSPDEVRQRMAPAYAIRVLDALGGGAAARAHDGVHMIRPT
jgi:8-oxo-dGTP diphosphatase